MLNDDFRDLMTTALHSSFHAQSENLQTPTDSTYIYKSVCISNWIGLREILQETIDFP